MNRSLNEYLFEPILPVITVDKKERYPDDRNLERDLYGLKRRLEPKDNRYVETFFSEDFRSALFGKMKVTCYVFKTKINGRSGKETKETIRNEFFKNNMSVLFSINGQVHGHYTSEFITRSLKLNLLKEHLLIHVDCTDMNYNFRKELFMASRDRLKGGEETRELRKFLAEKLGDKNGRLAEIHKRWKASIAIESEDAKDLIKSLAQNFSRNQDLLQLLGQALNLQAKGDKKRNTKKSTKNKSKKDDMQPFNPQKFPAFFKRSVQGKAGNGVVSIPIGGEKTVLFDTNVENNYFDRIEDPGELKIALLDFKTNETQGGEVLGKVDRIENVFNARKSSPQEGTIKIHLNPTEEVSVGDEARINVSLSDPSGSFFQETFWVKISKPKAPLQPSPKLDDAENPNLGLPEVKLVHEKDWDQFGEVGETMDHSTVMYPEVEGEKLEKIFINMDSRVLLNFKAKIRNPNQDELEAANRRYIAAVYSHTLFLYSITKGHKYQLVKEKGGTNSDVEDVELGTYLKDLFESYYAEFLLNFGFDEITQLMQD